MTNQAKESRRQALLLDIDLATEPAKMSQPEALEFLEELAADLEARIEALKEEMGED